MGPEGGGCRSSKRVSGKVGLMWEGVSVRCVGAVMSMYIAEPPSQNFVREHFCPRPPVYSSLQSV